MTKKESIEKLRNLLNEWENDPGIIRHQDFETQKWLGEILPLLKFNYAHHANASQAADILVQHGYSSSLYQKMEARLILIVRQAIGELENNDMTQQSGASRQSSASFWEDLHPTVVSKSKSRYDSGHYSDAVEAALKELNCEIKKYVMSLGDEEKDGASLMRHAFSPANPRILLEDMNSSTGKNIQQGYMDIFAGTMTGIRNPKAHNNIDMDAFRCRHFLYLASLLFQVFDERQPLGGSIRPTEKNAGQVT